MLMSVCVSKLWMGSASGAAGWGFSLCVKLTDAD